MDIFEFRTQNIRDLPINFESQLNMNPEMEDLEFIFKGLEKLMIKEISILWDIAALEHYIAEQMIPQGLRWQLPLNIGGEDAHDLMAWEEFLKHCSNNAMNLIVEMRKKKLLDINEQIEEYKMKLDPFKNLEDYQEFSTMCQRNLKKVEAGIKEKKFKKYLKTKNDFDNKTVFKWNKTINPLSSEQHGCDMETNNILHPLENTNSVPPIQSTRPNPSRFARRPNPQRYNKHFKTFSPGYIENPPPWRHPNNAYHPNPAYRPPPMSDYHHYESHPPFPRDRYFAKRNPHYNRNYSQPIPPYGPAQPHQTYGGDMRARGYYNKPKHFPPPLFPHPGELCIGQGLPFNVGGEGFPHRQLGSQCPPPGSASAVPLHGVAPSIAGSALPTTPGGGGLDAAGEPRGSLVPSRGTRDM